MINWHVSHIHTGKIRITCNIWIGNLTWRGPAAARRVLLKQISKKQDLRAWTRFNWLITGSSCRALQIRQWNSDSRKTCKFWMIKYDGFCYAVGCIISNLHKYPQQKDRLCGLMVRVSGYKSWGPGFDSWALQEKRVVGLERGSLSLVSTTEELLGRNSSGSGLESREYGRRDSSRWPRGTLYPQKLGTNFADKRRSVQFACGLRPRSFFINRNFTFIKHQPKIINNPPPPKAETLRVVSTSIAMDDLRINVRTCTTRRAQNKHADSGVKSSSIPLSFTLTVLLLGRTD
jgi:hypothetical protein